MALRTPPVWLQAGSYSAEDDRSLLRALVATSGIGATGTYVPADGKFDDLKVTQNGTPNMSVNVAVGTAFVAGTTVSTTQGVYSVTNGASTNVAVSAAHATLPRIDLVCVTVRDSQYAGGSDDVILQVVAGTPASSPAAPSAPDSSLVLAQLAVGAAVTSILTANITDVRASAGGGLMQTRGQSAIKWWRGGLGSTKSIANANRYYSIQPSSKLFGEGLTPSFTGDAMVLPAGLYRLNVKLTWPTGTSGVRRLSVFQDASVTTLSNSSTDASGGTKLWGHDISDNYGNATNFADLIIRSTGTTQLLFTVYSDNAMTLGTASGTNTMVEVEYKGP